MKYQCMCSVILNAGKILHSRSYSKNSKNRELNWVYQPI